MRGVAIIITMTQTEYQKKKKKKRDHRQTEKKRTTITMTDRLGMNREGFSFITTNNNKREEGCRRERKRDNDCHETNNSLTPSNDQPKTLPKETSFGTTTYMN